MKLSADQKKNNKLPLWGVIVILFLINPALKASDIVSLTVKTTDPRQPEITMLLKLPSEGKDNKPVEGVICFCTWEKDPSSLQQHLENTDGAFAYLMKYAEEKHFAVLTWTTASLWNAGKNFDDYDKKAYEALFKEFGSVADAWENAFLQLANKYSLPKEGLLLSGVSRGGQWVHRLALERPDRFLAVHAHISSSYAKPVPQAKNILWLITTGQSESGFESSSDFYANCKELGYPIIYKAEGNLAHEGSPLAMQLELAFFDYALELKKRITTHFDQEPSSIRMAGFSNPPFVGDFVNNVVFPVADQDIIPEHQRVGLPTKALAEAWGPILK